MPDERAETIKRAYETQFPEEAKKWSGGQQPPAESAPAEQTAQPEQPASEGEKTPAKEEIMIPKARFDEINDELKEARRQLQNQPPKVEQVKEPEIEQDAQRVLDDIISRKLAPLQQKLSETEIRLEVDQVQKEFPDFGKDVDLTRAALEKIKKNPAYSLSDAYRIVSYDKVQSSSRELGKQEAYKTAQDKAVAHGESGGRRVQQRSIDELVRDKSVPLSEIKKLLPHS